jgi:hypothetical protein
MQYADEYVDSLIEGKGIVILDCLEMITLYFGCGLVMGESGFDMLSIEGEFISIIGALALLFLDAVVDNLNNAWEIGPSKLIDIFISLQSLLSVSFVNIVPL